MTTPAPLSLIDGLPVADRAAWLRLVEKTLQGADFDKRLVTHTADGIAVRPLYTRADALADAATAAPGVAPFTRGVQTARPGAAWDIRQIHAEPDAALANAAILDDLAGGVTSVMLQIAAPGWFGLDYREPALAAALEGVLLDVCGVHLRAGEYTPDAAGSLLALWRKAGVAEAHRVGGFNYDPLGALAQTGALYHPIETALGVAARLAIDAAPLPRVTALLAHGHTFHAAGAAPAEELGLTLACLVAYLRACDAAGLPPERALGKIAVCLAVDADQFMGVAKLRAARRLIWRVAAACGAGDAAARVPLSAETSFPMMTRRDPWVNLLRTTIACAAAAMGGADAITVLPYCWPLGRPDAFARRIARNIHIVLQEESGLGRVVDPAGGAWAVECLTDDLARKAWAVFQSIEAKGGMAQALAGGQVQDLCAASARAHARGVATVVTEITGVSTYPKLGDDGVNIAPWPSDCLSADLGGARVRPLGFYFPALAFETLRNAADDFAKRAGHPPRVFLASLGSLAEHAARTTWMTNFLAAGGIEAIVSEGYTSSTAVGAAFAAGGAEIACLCASDATYGALGEATAALLKTAGARKVYVAGRAKGFEAELRSAGVDAFVYAGIDAVATLTQLHAALGVEPRG